MVWGIQEERHANRQLGLQDQLKHNVYRRLHIASMSLPSPRVPYLYEHTRFPSYATNRSGLFTLGSQRQRRMSSARAKDVFIPLAINRRDLTLRMSPLHPRRYPLSDLPAYTTLLDFD
ncbi:hypothetical protein AB1N83_011412 [Pleurotus pulmonarius]